MRVIRAHGVVATLLLVAAGCGGSSSSPEPVGVTLNTGLAFQCRLGSGDCSAVMEGQQVLFVMSRRADLTLRSTTLDAGDGSAPQSLSWPASGTTLSVPHIYPRRGTFSARLTVVDGTGGSETQTQTITVGSVVSVAMTAEPLGSLQAVATAVVAGATATRFEWTFDPQVSPVVTTIPRASFTYPTPGWKDLSLQVTVDDGRVFRASASVVVQ